MTFKELYNLRRHHLIYALLVGLMLLIAGCGTAEKTTVPVNKTPVPAEVDTSIESNEEPVPETPPEKESALIEPLQIPETPREFRAAWIASVANIDWPSKPGLPVAEQKAELRALMDRATQLNMNAIILQVRPTADALYQSPYEPWSEFLTGKQGRPPNPYYDPLEFAVEEAHVRGLELHAWFNPFRAYHSDATSGFAPSHIKNRRPELVLSYGRYWWLDPGQKDARKYSLDVIVDVARRYDIDGVHLDDYFYPYTQKNARGRDISFPDEKSYQAYVKQYGPISRTDWRRQNINRFVEQLHKELRRVKPSLRFGISPFGIWRPGNPPQIKGFDAYNRIYADAKKWFNEGWVDYLSPQLYWPIDQPAQSFPVLLAWWQQQNTHNRHLWPGLYTSRAVNEWSELEIGRQIRLTRQQKGADGHIHFSIKPLMKNTGNIASRLLDGEYAQPALVPATEWLAGQRPPQPEALLQEIENFIAVTLNPASEMQQWLWVLKVKYGDTWKIMINPGGQQRRTLPAENYYGSFKGAVVSFINRLGTESVPQILLPLPEQAEGSP